ncbi:nucleotidyltransferase [Lentibacillus saliphilus]|uniref:nucleotidyltransferase n=1 Tax=Lentibacillus saliphilus TaxID=2737028 RepID=UPI001C30CB08|nr:nucleotidyltransferase [Lentibacillus saliphilus]
MQACGLVVEYNPFHNGHVYHIEQSKIESGADCIIAVMSGSFLQRGEPAIIDKFHRAQAALSGGADIVLELPYVFSVQGSSYFADGAVRILHELGVDTLCFGSESGDIKKFEHGYEQLSHNFTEYRSVLKESLSEGMSFPTASKRAYKSVGLDSEHMDLAKPNNILGFSYVRSIRDRTLPIRSLTIQRTKSNYHDPSIVHDIASATSIRNEIKQHKCVTTDAARALPNTMRDMLTSYKAVASIWHDWEHYFPYLHYKVVTMTLSELACIHGVDEGLEHRIKKTAKTAESFEAWITALKTKRYTRTRLQRMFVHILTGTTKTDMARMSDPNASLPYVRILGMTKNGQAYLNKVKKTMQVPLITKLSNSVCDMLAHEERVSNVYYSILPPGARKRLFKQELSGPVLMNASH